MATNPHTISTLQAEVDRLQHCLSELEYVIHEQPAYEDAIHAIFDTVNDAMCIHMADETGAILDVNRQMLKLFCIEQSQAIGLSLFDLLHPDYPNADIVAVFRQVMAGEVYQLVWNVRRPYDQTEFAAEWILRRVTFQQKPCILATVRDINQPQPIDQAILQHSTLLKGFLDHCPALMFVRDTQGHFILINQFYANLLHQPPEAIVGKTPHQIMAADAANLFLSNDHRVLETGQTIRREEVSSVGTFSSIKFPIYDDHDQIVAIGGISLDISEHKRVEQTMHNMMALVENSTSFVATMTFEATPVYINASGLKLVGLPSMHEARSYRMHDFVFPDDRAFLEQHILPTVHEQGRWEGELRFRHFQTGESIPVYYTSFVVTDAQTGQSLGLGTITRDMREQKRVQAERLALQQQVIDAQQAALRELSTPLLPISDNVVVMPLIGTIDHQRAQMVLETLLEGVARHQADLAILDITGVQMVDTQVADALVRAARAVRLLGAQVMLTGIQPQIAQTLVHLGVDLSGIMTQGSLQAGIAYALSHM